MIFLVIKRFSDNKTQKVCLEVIIYLGAILSVFALWQFISNSFGIFESLSFLRDEYKKGVFSFPRVQATFLEPLFFANFLIIPFFLSLRKTIEQKTVNLQHLYLFLISMAIVLTLSRGAFFAIIIGLGVFLGFYLLVYKHKIGKLVSPFLVLILSVLFSVGLIFVSSGKTGINSYLGQATNVVDVQGEDQVGSLEFLRTRNFTVKTALNHSRENLLGLGVGAFGSLPEFEPLRERGHQQTVNNEYLEILVEGGLASLILIVLFFLSSLLIAIRSFLKSKQLLDLVFLSVMVALLCQYLTFSNLYLIYFWVFWGLISSKKTTTQGSY
jgi:O-antigen ligase